MDENVVLSNNTPLAPPQNKEVKLVDIPIKDENTALNVMVSFLSLAQKRGIFSFDESAKIWECIKMFKRLKISKGLKVFYIYNYK
jgi:hypothetical protein